ncbi:DUF2521 family protein [Ectobacillus antri]|jgi:hypothetical protein|uniref:DUF2521 family protein n=1 Tax=Ectobacillus antri TaxID=2486280 RepID=A0ABT6H7U3_9BACI|nr:DUF2521 family protein [Ectobacillus antri]MDG4657899.1 DUF2521 family protein [Ectobacillus antri]MDG5754848.1 DUF2521 family protein [Ectobacillus antri]
MTIVTTLTEKRREKQLKYEKRLLRELSLQTLRSGIHNSFIQYMSAPRFARHLEDYCLELAVESYLLGARYSKFGYYGESLLNVKIRSHYEESHLAETLFQFLCSIPASEFIEECHQSLYDTCHEFISCWWTEGYTKGERRYRLRLR